MYKDYALKAVEQNRENALQACRQAQATKPAPQPAPDPDVAMCQLYANQTVAIATKASAFGCGFAGPRWGQDFNAHYNWCISNPNPVIMFGETARHDADFKACTGN